MQRKINTVKILIATIIIVSLTSCVKNSSQSNPPGVYCWRCIVAPTGGATPGDPGSTQKDTCTQNGAFPQFVDSNGNDLTASCQRK